MENKWPPSFPIHPLRKHLVRLFCLLLNLESKDSPHSPVCSTYNTPCFPTISLALPICDISAWEQIPLTHLQTAETLILQILSSVSSLFQLQKKTSKTDLQGLSCNIIDISILMSHPTSLILAASSHTLHICQYYSLSTSSNTDNSSASAGQEFTVSQKTACCFIIQLVKLFGITCPFTLGAWKKMCLTHGILCLVLIRCSNGGLLLA